MGSIAGVVIDFTPDVPLCIQHDLESGLLDGLLLALK
jgi:hypothetical protein